MINTSYCRRKYPFAVGSAAGTDTCWNVCIRQSEWLFYRYSDLRNIVYRRRLDWGRALERLKNALDEAVHYTLKCWSGLTQYLENGHIPIDDNGAENGIRPFVIGRKNWMFCDTVNGAHASTRMYSIIETAKVNALEPYHYLKYLFTQLPKANSEAEVQKLLPWQVDTLTLQ